MNYSISCSSDQASIIDKLKSAGAEVIQSSGGLVCKSSLSITALKTAIGLETCTIEPITDIAKESPDIQKFLNQK